MIDNLLSYDLAKFTIFSGGAKFSVFLVAPPDGQSCNSFLASPDFAHFLSGVFATLVQNIFWPEGVVRWAMRRNGRIGGGTIPATDGLFCYQLLNF